MLNIGIDQKNCQLIADGLKVLLADTYALYLKTQNYHWNVEGPMFQPLHGVFEEQYSQLAEANDELAERIRALGIKAPGSFNEFSDLSSLSQANSTLAAREMVQDLLQNHEEIIRKGREMIGKFQGAGDEGSADLVIGRLQEHEKTAWILRSFLVDL